MEIKQQLIPVNMKRTRPGIKMAPKYITVHTTDNPSKGANANAHARLQSSGNPRQASWHYQVDDKEIWQSIPDNEVAWHAGDGRGPGNTQSIGVEICVNQDGNFDKAKQNAIWLIRKLMMDYCIPVDRVVSHKYWSGKNCPAKLLPVWNEFIKEVQAVDSNKPRMIRVEVDGKPVIDSVVAHKIMAVVKSNLGKHMVIKLRE